jgi:MFS family permease
LDRKLLYTTSFLRAFATGLIGIALGFHLAHMGFDAASIGLIVGVGLCGGATSTLVVTLFADRLGHRRTLLCLSALSALGAVVLTFASTAPVLAAAAFFGMVNGMGRDRGGAFVLEQALLPATIPNEKRTYAFAVYHVLQDVGSALGSLVAGLPALLARGQFPEAFTTTQSALGLYAFLFLVPLLLYSRLSSVVESTHDRAAVRVSPESKRILWKISSLFALDSIGGGFLTTALLSYFFFERFGVSATEVGVLFFAARVLNGLSHLGAAWLARRIGLVNTMVFTHIPSSVLLVTVGIAPSFEVAAILFLIREGFVEMDVPTRQSYVMAVVRPEERTFATGVTQLVRLGGWAIAPVFAGMFMERFSLAMPLVVAAAMKITYDLLLYREFRHVKPPEERA